MLSLPLADLSKQTLIDRAMQIKDLGGGMPLPTDLVIGRHNDTRDIKRACHDSTFPGFIRFMGSSADLIARMSFNSIADL